MSDGRTDLEDRFWLKVDQDGPVHSVLGTPCWNWTGGKTAQGYGLFSVHGRLVGAHRFSYVLHVDAIPPRADIDHRCHNESCVNPAHLRAATRKQNMENLRGAHRDSRSGVRGVWLHDGRWRAAVMHNGKRFYVGFFDTPEEAHTAVVAKRLELFSYNDVDRETS